MAEHNSTRKAITTRVFPIGQLHDEISQGLTIPSIQRDYKWGPGHEENEELNSAAYVFLEDMLDFHTLRQDGDIYFTGTMIVFEEDVEPRTQLMDGQQRWTTITVLMSIIRHLLLENQGIHVSTITDLRDRFLELRNGDQMLESRKRDDRRTIQKLIKISEGEKLATALPKALKNNFVFKRNNTTYKGTSINCVAEYFYDRLKANFNIRGSQSDASGLVKFYETLRDHVYINYSHTMSPNLAYKMFVTANSRGTPLNNFDVFRGLVLAHCRIKQLGTETELQELLDAGDTKLQEYVDVTRKKDFGKAVDRVMSEIVSMLEGEKISVHHVMSRVEHRISSISTKEHLAHLVENVCGYIDQLLKIGKQQGKVGRVQHLRMNSFGFIQHIPYYAAARLKWGEQNKNILSLLNTIETIVTRKLILMGGNVSKLFYAISSQHLQLIYQSSTEEQQHQCIKKIRKDFKDAKENPTDFEIKEHLKFRQFDLEKTSERNKLIAAMLCLEPENKLSKHEFKTNQRNPKIINFMPKYNWSAPAIGFEYPDHFFHKQTVHTYIGNCFILKGDLTKKDISKFNEHNSSLLDRKRFISQNSIGISTSQSLNTSWNHGAVNHRTEALANLLIKRFPENMEVK